VPSSLTPGGGSVPDESFPSLAIELAGDAQHTLDLLRGGEPPVIGTIRDGRVLLDLSTVLPQDLPQLRRALQALLPPA
jgi:L-seryl-tRNA(Ser) seleniumtransferase